LEENYEDIYYMTRRREKRYLPILKNIPNSLKSKIVEFKKEEENDYKN
jgi:hypothetical protein